MPTMNERLAGYEDPTTLMILRAMAQAGSPGTAAVSRESLEAALGQPLPASEPATLWDRLGAVASFAGNAIMGRGGFNAPPFSKVMEKGQPKRVYRGTPQAYAVEDPAKWNPQALYGPGAYFTESPEVASGYTQTRRSAPLASTQEVAHMEHAANEYRRMVKGEIPMATGYDTESAKAMVGLYEKRLAEVERSMPAPNVRASYLDITKPFDLDKGRLPVQDVRQIALDLWNEGRAQGVSLDDMRALASRFGDKSRLRLTYDQLATMVSPHRATQILRRMGYDGLTHIGGGRTQTKPHRVWIAFTPRQEYGGFTPLEQLP